MAYRGSEHIGLGKDKDAIFRECRAAGLEWGEFIIFGIVPQDDEIVFGPAGI